MKQEISQKVMSLAKRRGFLWPSFEIYGGTSGFFDYGPLGVALKRNFEDLWRYYYICIEEFLEILKSSTTIKVITIDENGTTKKANEVMIKAGLTREKRKEYKDQIAAQLILEDYLARL